MRSILYWSALILASILLAYITPFSLVPLAFVGGSLLLALGYILFRGYRRRLASTPDQRGYRVGFIGSIIVFIMTFWTTVGLFSNVKEDREFVARYEPYTDAGTTHGYTFYYLEYPGKYERIDSPELNQFLAEHHPERVHMILEVVRDFGRLRAYSVKSVESIPVDKFWTDGDPPWDALRKR